MPSRRRHPRNIAHTTRGTTLVAALPLAFAALAAPATARAQSSGAPSGDVRTAEQAFDRGTRQYRQRDYAGAATWYETADRLAPNAVALQSAIRAHREANTPEHLARAATLAEQMQSRYGSEPRSAAFAAGVIRELSPLLGRVSVRCGSCELEVDHTLQPGVEVYVAPGRHTLTAHWAGGRTRESIANLAAGRTETVALTDPSAEPVAQTGGGRGTGAGGSTATVALPVVEPARPRAGGGISPAVFFVGLGVTAVVGGVALWSWLDAQAGGDELIRQAMATHAANPTLERDVNSREDRTTGLVIATGAVGAITLTTLFFTRWSSPRSDAAPVQVTPTVGRAGEPGLTLYGSF